MFDIAFSTGPISMSCFLITSDLFRIPGSGSVVFFWRGGGWGCEENEKEKKKEKENK